MAVLNNIRKRSVFLIVIIALALFAFVFADVIQKGGFTSQKSMNTIGTVNGEDIDRTEFMMQVENMMQARRGMPNMQVVNQVWDAKINQVLLQQQIEKLGIQVSDKQMNQLFEQQLANSPNFQNQAGVFDPEVLEQYVANLKATNDLAYKQWVNYEENVAKQAESDIYLDLVKAGVGATLTEGKNAYHLENDQINIRYVQIPYSSVEDIEITDKEVLDYMKKNPKKYETKATRDIQYVLFEELPSPEDEKELKEELTALMESRVEYNAVTGKNDTIAGFRNTENAGDFVNQYSDIQYRDRFQFKEDLPQDTADTLISLEVGDTYGPYKQGGYWKISKIIEAKHVADSAKASHILISYNSASGTSESMRTKEEAKSLADSLFKVVKSDKDKFSELAQEFSEDPGSKSQGGDLGWFTYGMMVPEFNEFVFENAEGSMGMVETDFGFHIISIEEKTEAQKAVKIATLARQIEASENTLNTLYAEATDFSIKTQEQGFNEVVKAEGLPSRPVEGIKELDANLPGLGQEREIVQWAFNEKTSVGDIQRFDIANGGYVVVQLTAKVPEGLIPVDKAAVSVKPILQKKKKAEIIKSKISSGASLSDIAKNHSVSVQTANSLSLSNPTIAGAGDEPAVVGAAFSLEKDEISKPISGEKGVYVVQLVSKTIAPEIPSYVTYMNQLTQERSSAVNQAGTGRAIEALKESAEIKDNRARFY